MDTNTDRIEPDLVLRGAPIYRSFLDRKSQVALVEDLRNVVAAAPVFNPETRWGKRMSVRMTSAGKYGWFSDRTGYRYIDHHPAGGAWPAIPLAVLDIWRQVTNTTRNPDCCLVNFYDARARMGMHQDNDEADFSQPVVSISLGDDALFRIGGTERGGKTDAIWLSSGDVLVLEGDARLAYHGVDRVRAGSSSLLGAGGRINLTLRVVA